MDSELFDDEIDYEEIRELRVYTPKSRDLLIAFCKEEGVKGIARMKKEWMASSKRQVPVFLIEIQATKKQLDTIRNKFNTRPK